MKQIRTSKGKLFGTVDNMTQSLCIKDGNTLRFINIPQEGLKLQYLSGSGPPETIFIAIPEILNPK